MDDFDRLKAELFKDVQIKAEYDALEPEYELIKQIIKARAEKKMTQKQLAEKGRICAACDSPILPDWRRAIIHLTGFRKLQAHWIKDCLFR
ncbi:hypothetical protein [Treponema parvum]|uniref:hypothetical protein n=1 Tax=Treponema parvum TaxID=138851 RepID=UPI001AEBCC5F|nr:hypothetical protein [Treponema parvum]